MLTRNLAFWAAPSIFELDFAAGNGLTSAGTFSRSTVATVMDHEAAVRQVLSGELRFRGLRRVANLFPSSASPATQAVTVVVGRRYVFYFRDGGGSGSYALDDGGTYSETVAEGEAAAFTATGTTLTCTLSGTPGAGATVQLELRGIANDAPSEYVDSATTYNAGVAGVRYFQTTNGNSFTAPGPGAVTEAAGSTISTVREGLLVEGAATQQLLNSNLFTSSWTLVGATIETSTEPSPMGGSAVKLQETTATGSTHRIYQLNRPVTGTFIQDIFVKAAGRTRARFAGQSGAPGSQNLEVDLTAKTISNQGYATGELRELGSAFPGWFRVCMRYLSGTETVASCAWNLEDASGNTTYDGDGSSGMYIAQGQIIDTALTIPSTIISGGSTTTRNADAVTLGSWPSGVWTALFTGKIVVLAGERTLYGGSTSTNRIWIDASGNLNCRHGATTTTTANAITAGATFKAAVVYDGSTYYACLNGGTVASNTSGGTYSGSVTLGSTSTPANYLNDTVAFAALYPRADTSAQMQAETT